MATKEPGNRKDTGRDSKGRFTKGKSGNPNGRAKIPADLKEAFKAQCPKALDILVGIMNDPVSKDNDRIRAAEIILDRGYGKPAQAVELETKNVPRVVFVGENDILD